MDLPDRDIKVLNTGSDLNCVCTGDHGQGFYRRGPCDLQGGVQQGRAVPVRQQLAAAEPRGRAGRQNHRMEPVVQVWLCRQAPASPILSFE